MSECVVLPKNDWQEILDAVRYGTEGSGLLRSGEVASEVMSLVSIIDGLVDDSLESFESSRLTSIPSYALSNRSNMTSVVLPNVTEVHPNAFRQNKGLLRADFSSLNCIHALAFYSAQALQTLIIRTNTVCPLESVTAFTSTRISIGDGYVYVPAALVEEYKQATNWTTFADNIRAIEDYPEITGGTI